MEAALLDRVCQAIDRAWHEGCPVAAYDHAGQEKTAQVAWRRWRSGQRRHVKPGFDARIQDLSKGLITSLSPDPVYVEPLKKDWEYLAHRIAEELAKENV